jgi:hypothetical protein
MTRNIQDYIDRGYTYEELLSQGLADPSDLESYESAYSLPNRLLIATTMQRSVNSKDA